MLGERVAIKEFFVKDFCNRDEATAHVTIGTQSKRGLVDKLKRKFIEEAKMLYRMQHSGIVRVFDIFEENETAYFAMDYIDGSSLSEIVNKNKRTQSVADFLALLDGEKTDSKLSQSSNVQTQPTSEETTKLTNEEETLVIGESRGNTQLDKEKKKTPREPSATLVESKAWKELL